MALKVFLVIVLRSLVEDMVKLSFFEFLITLFDRCFQRTQANANGTEVATFINLENGVEFIVSTHDFFDLVCRYGVKPTTKAVELHQLEVWIFSDNLRCSIQARMVNPLIDHT